jgi:transcriptional regulator with XRE-family HTH domain
MSNINLDSLSTVFIANKTYGSAMRRERTEFGKNLDFQRKKAKITLDSLASKSGYSPDMLYRLMRGERRYNVDILARLSKVLGCNPSDLIATEGKALVKVEGYVGAGAEIHPIEEGSNFVIDGVEAPPGVDPDSVTAVIVKGDSMFPAYRDGDVIYYTKDCDYDPSVLRKECVVKVKGGAAFVKVLKPGTKPKHFTLQSYNSPDQEDVQIEWACKVLWVKKAQ